MNADSILRDAHPQLLVEKRRKVGREEREELERNN